MRPSPSPLLLYTPALTRALPCRVLMAAMDLACIRRTSAVRGCTLPGQQKCKMILAETELDSVTHITRW